MSDYTGGYVTIHACPPHRVKTVLTILENYGLDSEYADDDAPDTGADTRPAVHLDAVYACENTFTCGHITGLADALIKDAPDVAFSAHEAPAYDGLGTTCIHVPGLGLFTADCDSHGEPMFTQTRLLKLADEPLDVRQQALGLPWSTAIAAMPPGCAVVEPERFVTLWNRRHGEVIVVGGKQCGGELIFAGPAAATNDQVDAALAERGFQPAEKWTRVDEPHQLWRTDVYRCPTP